MGAKLKIKPISIAVQALNLRKMFGGTTVTTKYDRELTWTCTLSPSPLGDDYKVRMVYQIGTSPKVYVVNPKPLEKAEGKNFLPHCYDTKKQHLCLYYPDGREWNKSMLLINTVIPWTYEWLYHYEIWLGNGGVWTGGGVHPLKKVDKN